MKCVTTADPDPCNHSFHFVNTPRNQSGINLRTATLELSESISLLHLTGNSPSDAATHYTQRISSKKSSSADVVARVLSSEPRRRVIEGGFASMTNNDSAPRG